MSNPLRACPICPNCGSKKFRKLESDDREVVLVRCIRCGHKIKI